jgi:hypothetical protein
MERQRHRWMSSIKMDLGEIRRNYVNWINLDQDRDQWRAFVNTIMNIRVP